MEEKTTKNGRIAKVIARTGLASRRDVERIIKASRVSVNGNIISSPALNVTAKDRIMVDGKEISLPDAERLWLFHKPIGLVTTNRDEHGRKTIFDVIPNAMPRVLTIGRLDLNSEGLLLLTNDGGVKRKLELPSTGWLRRYRVRIKGTPDDTILAPLRKGLTLGTKHFRPMEITLDRQLGANAWLTIALREGKNREIRNAIEHIGFMVNRLIRVSYGPFQLGTLKPGEIEEVRPKVLRDQVGINNGTHQVRKVRLRKRKKNS